jgi:hypothetical protein
MATDKEKEILKKFLLILNRFFLEVTALSMAKDVEYYHLKTNSKFHEENHSKLRILLSPWQQ